MATAKKAPEAVINDPMAELEAQRKELIAKVAASPTISGAAKTLYERTTKWAGEVGLGKSVSGPSAKVIKLGKQLDEYCSNESASGGKRLRDMFSTILEEEIPLKNGNGDKITYRDGIVVIMTELPHLGNYEVNIPLFVINGTTGQALPTKDGGTPKHLEEDLKYIKIPSEAEICTALAAWYIGNLSQAQDFINKYGKSADF